MDRETKRHNNVLNKIEIANNKKELPSISYTNVINELSKLITFNGKTMDKKKLERIGTALDKGYSFTSEFVEKELKNIIYNEIGYIDEGSMKFIFDEIKNIKKINNMLYEIQLKNQKIFEIENKEKKDKHYNNLKRIGTAYDMVDLPKVGLTELNKELLSCVNDNEYNNTIKTSEINKLTNAYLNNESFDKIKEIVKEICLYQLLDSPRSREIMELQILSSLIMNDTNIRYIAEEIRKKEERKPIIYKSEHIYIMEKMKSAKRISDLPENINIAKLTSYLSGNSTIYTNDNRIKNGDLRQLSILLLNGCKFEDKEIKDEINKICNEKYSDKVDAYELLYDKLSKLPKTYYLVKEIRYSLLKQRYFIKKSSSKVNVYFLPYLKSRRVGGKFYKCYLNRSDLLDLDSILPADLTSIIPPKKRKDPVEYYIQNNVDVTFKLAGGIILKLDEIIGSITVFVPNDGKIGIDPKDKEKFDLINNLDKEIENKRNEKDILDEQIENRKLTNNILDTEKEKLIQEIEQLKKIKSELNQEIESSIKEYCSEMTIMGNQMIESANKLNENYESQKVKIFKNE